jgi:hypothetical protein
MTPETLTPGIYRIAPDCKAFVYNGTVQISVKHVRCADPTPRCRDCKHFGNGRIDYNSSTSRNVCLIRPKSNGRCNGYPAHVIQQQRYYAAYPNAKRCEQYEPKQNTEQQ